MPGNNLLTSKISSAKEKAVGGVKDRCIKGKCCSATCISTLKVCLVELPLRVQALIKRVASALSDKAKDIASTLFKERPSFLRDLGKSLGKSGAKIDFTDTTKSELKIDKPIGKNKISILLDRRGTEFSFKVNDSFGRPFGLSTRDGVRLAREAERLFREIISHMKPGSVVEVYVYNADGNGARRKRAFEGFGFGSDSESNKMYGKVSADGRIEASTPKEMKEFRSKGEFNFAQSSSLPDQINLMYVILFGEEPEPGVI